jgi:hypothetical protein
MFAPDWGAYCGPAAGAGHEHRGPITARVFLGGMIGASATRQTPHELRPARGRPREPLKASFRAAKPGGNPRQGSWGAKSGGAQCAAEPGLVERMFNRWLITAQPSDRLVYHRGLLAQDKMTDPHLARLAEYLLTLFNGRYDVVSECGHCRGEIVGSKQVELFTRREHGELVYLAIQTVGP